MPTSLYYETFIGKEEVTLPQELQSTLSASLRRQRVSAPSDHQNRRTGRRRAARSISFVPSVLGTAATVRYTWSAIRSMGCRVH